MGDAGNIDIAATYLKTGYELIQSLPEEATPFELSKIFYNYGSFLFQMNDCEKALEVSEQGVLWAQQRCSHYYLEELFLLCGLICDELKLTEEAQEYFSLSKQVSKIR